MNQFNKILFAWCSSTILVVLVGMMVLTVVSCDDRFETFQYFNAAPSIYFNGSSTTTALEGQVKTSLKHGSGTYQFSVNVDDPEKQVVSLSYAFAAGNGKIFLGNQEQNGTIAIQGNAASVTFRAVDDGNVILNLTATDAFGAKTTAEIKLTVFANLPPVASFTWANKKLDGPYYVEFDASASIDKDQDQGGGIQLYRYTIKKNGAEGVEVINTNKTIVPYNLRGPGGYDVTLEVFDNDGAKSDPFKPTTANQVTVN